MNTNHPLPPQAIPVAKQFFRLFAFVLLVMLLFRAAFWVFAAPDMPEPLSLDTLYAFYLGFRFDARITAFFLLPLGLVLCIPGWAERLHRHAQGVAAVYAVLFFLLIAVYSLDFGFYDYLKVRVSTLLFELLADMREAVGMATQSYPVVWISLSVLAATALCAVIFYRLLRVPVYVDPRRNRRILTFLCILGIMGLALYGRLFNSWFPLRWSNAFFTTQEAVIALGLNPVQNIYDTWNSASADFSVEKAREAYPAMAEYLLVDKPDPETLNYLRLFPAQPEAAGRPRPNIVLIIMESLAYPKTSFAPGAADPTPRLRELAGQSLLFRNFYANARTTARAIFTTITGIPDVNVGGTASRNPLLADQRVIANEFKGYDKYYLIGGNTSWANVRSVLATNIAGLKILEENDWKASGVDVWGVSDYDLLQEANELFAAHDPQVPFLAVIQTSSFHKPYTVPKEPGLDIPEMRAEDLHNYGFIDQEEYASLYFTDFAVGEFMRRAKESGYYDRTVFFIFGDHGLNDLVHNLPQGYVAAGVHPWHVPLLIHASPKLGLITPGESETPCSQVDIFPTAAGLAGIAYQDWTLGRNIFDPRYAHSRSVYIGDKGAGIRLVADGYCYYNNGADGEFLFNLNSAEAANLAASEPDRFAAMQKQALDIDATVRYMLFNNRKSE